MNKVNKEYFMVIGDRARARINQVEACSIVCQVRVFDRSALPDTGLVPPFTFIEKL